MIGTWVLIMTLVAPGSTGGSAINQIGGFSSERMCAAAGNHWLNNLPPSWSRARAVCVVVR